MTVKSILDIKTGLSVNVWINISKLMKFSISATLVISLVFNALVIAMLIVPNAQNLTFERKVDQHVSARNDIMKLKIKEFVKYLFYYLYNRIAIIAAYIVLVLHLQIALNATLRTIELYIIICVFVFQDILIMERILNVRNAIFPVRPAIKRKKIVV